MTLRPAPPRLRPDNGFESAALAAGALRVAGVDEAGRGPLAGPVTAAAVRLDPDRIPPGLDDSNRLRPEMRSGLAAILIATADVGVAHASVEEIDSLNILRASHLAMTRAIAALAEPPDHLLIDGNQLPKGLTIRADCVVKGDARVLSIAAASIVAKVTRDRMMTRLSQRYPAYGFSGHVGYGTPAHRKAILAHGPCPEHRYSFAPVKGIWFR